MCIAMKPERTYNIAALGHITTIRNQHLDTIRIVLRCRHVQGCCPLEGTLIDDSAVVIKQSG